MNTLNRAGSCSFAAHANLKSPTKSSALDIDDVILDVVEDEVLDVVDAILDVEDR